LPCWLGSRCQRSEGDALCQRTADTVSDGRSFGDGISIAAGGMTLRHTDSDDRGVRLKHTKAPYRRDRESADGEPVEVGGQQLLRPDFIQTALKPVSVMDLPEWALIQAYYGQSWMVSPDTGLDGTAFKTP
jgi:hypothetical protein